MVKPFSRTRNPKPYNPEPCDRGARTPVARPHLPAGTHRVHEAAQLLAGVLVDAAAWCLEATRPTVGVGTWFGTAALESTADGSATVSATVPATVLATVLGHGRAVGSLVLG